MKSAHAQVAALIKKHLKVKKIQSTVSSKSFAGGASVTVILINASDAVQKSVAEYCAQYEKGSFDGMTDSYDFSNVRGDIPQVKFLMIENERISAES